MEILSILHPIVIHFPIVFLFSYIILEILNFFLRKEYLKKASIITLFLGVIGGIFSVLTGNQSFQLLVSKNWITQYHRYFIEQHEFYASLTMWFFFAILIFEIITFMKNKKEVRRRYLFIIFAIVGLYLIYQTASIGGILVYELGIGTELLR